MTTDAGLSSKSEWRIQLQLASYGIQCYRGGILGYIMRKIEIIWKALIPLLMGHRGISIFLGCLTAISIGFCWFIIHVDVPF